MVKTSGVASVVGCEGGVPSTKARLVRERASGPNHDISVVVLTKNSARTLQKCLNSIVEQSSGEILAVDRLSADGTLEILKRYGVKVLPDAIGSIGYSRRVGVENATCPYVMFVDSDVELGKNCIPIMRSELERFRWAGIHARILSVENVTYWQKAEDQVFSRFFNRPGPRPHIGTIAALYKRELLLRNPFDPRFREACEDLDVCRRLVRNGHKLGVSSAHAYHYHRRSLSEFVAHRFSYGLGNARYALKYKSLRILIEPMQWAFIELVRSTLIGRRRLIPYWVTRGFAELFGNILGLLASRQERNITEESGSGRRARSSPLP